MQQTDNILTRNNVREIKNTGVMLSKGSNNNINQIFTRTEEVDIMISSIGENIISDINTTVLEPTSGDGAFTVRILEKRLNNIMKSKDYFIQSIIALSTIYAIEYELETILIHRNNLFSLMLNKFDEVYSSNDSNIELFKEAYSLVIKRIIFENIVCGSFHTALDTNWNINDRFEDGERHIGYHRTDDGIDFNKPIVFREWSKDNEFIEKCKSLSDLLG